MGLKRIDSDKKNPWSVKLPFHKDSVLVTSCKHSIERLIFLTKKYVIHQFL